MAESINPARVLAEVAATRPAGCVHQIRARGTRWETAMHSESIPEPSTTQVAVLGVRAGRQQVVETHMCDRWDALDGDRYRCGLTFGDGSRCRVTQLYPGTSWSQWLYERPTPTPTCDEERAR